MKKLFLFLIGLMVSVSIWANPTILVQPTNQSSFIGQAVTFSVQAQSTLPMAYQWWVQPTYLFNYVTNVNMTGTNVIRQRVPNTNGSSFAIAGATSTNVTVTNNYLNCGKYAVAVSDSNGNTASSQASLTIVASPVPTNAVLTLGWAPTPTNTDFVGYQIFSSTNLTTWQPYANTMNTNYTVTMPRSQLLSKQFFKVAAAFFVQKNPAARVSWQPLSVKEDLAGYIVRYGVSSGNYTASVSTPVTACTVPIMFSTNYYFIVSAYNTAGVEGPYSSEVTFSESPNTTTYVYLPATISLQYE